MEGTKVKFWWKDYKSSVKWKQMELDAFDFIKRFLLHVLPSGFYKLRHFDIPACVNNKIKNTKLPFVGSFPERIILRKLL